MPSVLLTDLYQLTMMQGAFALGAHRRSATFDLYTRRLPFRGGYAVWAGLEEALDTLAALRFSEEDLAYLDSLGLFEAPFLEALRGWRFGGRVEAFPEGSVVFAQEPLLSVTAPLWEAQLVETLLLNTLNFQTLVASKAARCVQAARAGGGTVVEFGARRAQGPDGAVSAARAAYVGGATATSNLEAGRRYGLPVVGTHAHAWVEAFPDELTAFRAYARQYPEATVLLLDTYDTLASGLPNALSVAAELRAAGHELRGVRLDSGDLGYLSARVRAALDAAGFPEVRVLASNDLDEGVIQSVISEGGRVDTYCIGTQLVTGGGEGGGALGGVYKLVELDGTPRMKLTADPAKASLPGVKRVWRGLNAQGQNVQDVLTLDGERPTPGAWVSDPVNPLRASRLSGDLDWQAARRTVMDGGRRTADPEALASIQARARSGLDALPEGTRRLLNPHLYRVSLSSELAALRGRLLDELRA